MPHSSTDPRTVPLSAQVDTQLMGRSSQKAERGTKVETVAEGVSPRRPLSALHSLYKTLGKVLYPHPLPVWTELGCMVPALRREDMLGGHILGLL